LAQQKSSEQSIFGDMQSTFQNMFGHFPAQPFDMASAMETSRKNFKAIAEANQCAISGWQSLAQRQAQMVSEFIQNNSGMATEGFAESSAQEKLARQTELLNSAYQRSIANTQELAQMASQCTKEAAEVISKRVVASINEIQAATGTDE